MSSQFKFLETETQFTAVHQNDCVPFYEVEMGSVAVYDSRNQKLLTVRYERKCVGCCDSNNNYTAEHESLGEVLRTQTIKNQGSCFLCCFSRKEEGIFAGQEHLGSIERREKTCKPSVGRLIDSSSNSVLDFFDDLDDKNSDPELAKIVFRNEDEEIAKLISEVEYTAKRRPTGNQNIHSKEYTVKGTKCSASITFPQHLSINIKLCLLMRTAMRAHEIYLALALDPDYTMPDNNRP